MTTNLQPNRIASIDILRALTMVLMIFVNDLWSLKDIPEWLEHTKANDDGMGLADVVFPAFLFIVGMSIPFAVNARRKKGDTDMQILGHILMRSGSLLIMGVFFVNGENINGQATGMSHLLWGTLCCVAFILIWNSYPPKTNIWFLIAARAVGVLILITLAILFRGGNEGNLNRFSTYWWGILGLIGWAYLASGIVYTFLGKQIFAVVAAWLVFVLLCIATHAGMIKAGLLRTVLGPMGDGGHTALVLGGTVLSMIYLHFKGKDADRKMLLIMVVTAAVLHLAGLYLRQFWGISKIHATPSWILICSALTILAFVFIYWLADIWGKAHWFKFIKPAGTNTLLCYLIPYFAYAFVALMGIHWPDFMLIGIVGLIKSFLFALLCVVIAGWLAKLGIQLKL